MHACTVGTYLLLLLRRLLLLLLLWLAVLIEWLLLRHHHPTSTRRRCRLPLLILRQQPPGQAQGQAQSTLYIACCQQRVRKKVRITGCLLHAAFCVGRQACTAQHCTA